MRQFLKHHLPKDIRAKLLTLERSIKALARPKVISQLYVFNELKKKTGDNRFSTYIKDIFPITGENTPYTSFDRHYIYHTSWAARVVQEIREQVSSSTSKQEFKHIDISSSLYFCGIVSSFIPVDFYDYRPADLRLEGLKTASADLMKLPFADQSVESISCMHTIEHVGLGRYGDPLDPRGDIKAIKELKRVVKVGGSLILVMPVGRQKIEFNAHRIYNPQYINDLVCGKEDKDSGSEGDRGEGRDEFELKEYAFIPETDKEGGIIRNADLKQGKKDNYACGCFWFMRKK